MRLRILFLLVATLVLANLLPAPALAHSSTSFQISGTISNWTPSRLTIQSQATDPLFPQQWDLTKLQIPQAWDTTTGSPVTIAIIDTGIDLNNPEFAGRLWTNPSEIPGNGIDDDHNGYVDDYNGYNFVNTSGNLTDGNGHGTGIASIIAANTNNGIGIAGINRIAKIMPVKALDSAGGGDFQNVIKSIHYAVDNGARLINMSFGSPDDEADLKAAIDYATNHNVIIVAASGNAGSGHLYYPSAYSSVISVGSVNSSNQRSSFSNYGPGLSVVAPGEGIIMAAPGGGFESGDGSSFSAAEITGLVSLLLAVDPSATPAQAAQLVETTSTHLGTSTPSNEFGYGIPDAQVLLTQALIHLTASISVSSQATQANGSDTSLVVATITDASGNLKTGIPISLQSTGSANIVNGSVANASTPVGTTDSQGQVRFSLTTVIAETKQLTLTASGAPITGGSTSVTFKPVAKPIYKMKWLGQSPYPTLAPGQSTTLWLEVQNTGNLSWIANSTGGFDRGQTKLGTDRAMDRSSNFYTANAWLSSNRAAYMQPSIVAPGATARFEFPITATVNSVSTREYFRPVIEQVAWLNDLGIYWDINVGGSGGSSISTNPADYQATLQLQSGGLTLSRQATGLLTLQIKNTGTTTWSPTGNSIGAGQVKLGTAIPRDRSSVFSNPSWLSANRVGNVGVAIPPGGTLTMTFPVTAPNQTGDYTESFQLVSEYTTWFGPSLTWHLHVI